jgi:hypothetical protein
MLALCIFSLMGFSLCAINNPPPASHLQSMETFRGQVLSVQKYNLVNRPAPYVQFILSANGVIYTVKVGPEWYVNEHGIVIVPMEEIEVKGVVIVDGGKRIIVASQILQGTSQLKLRDEEGTPLWSS